MFKQVDAKRLARFNSDLSCKLLSEYESQIKDDIVIASAQKPSKTIAPSSFRCERKSWFRLKGAEPDIIRSPDATSKFIADVGTVCHRTIQRTLKQRLKSNWIDVGEYLSSHLSEYPTSCEFDEDSGETLVSVTCPPIRFACDGLLKLYEQYVLLEIKTCESSTWSELTAPRDEHIDQVKLYSKILGVRTVLFLYVDRQYGQCKCYEVNITNSDIEYVTKKLNRILDFVDRNLAPEGLPAGDKWCNENYCQYYHKCKAYGRYRYE